MSFVKIKICGITNATDAGICHGAGADYLGFVFHPASPRYISPEAAGQIIRDLPAEIIPVGVFVNPTRRDVEETIETAGISIVQLSGDETPGFCGEIPLPVIKVVRPGSSEEVRTRPEDYPVFAMMVDGNIPGLYGGTGQSADIEFAITCAASSRCFLAGGLTDENVLEKIIRISPFAVDVSSGTEIKPGYKDAAKVERFCRIIHKHNAALHKAKE